MESPAPGVSKSDLAAAIARIEALLPPELLPLVGPLGARGKGRDDADATLQELQLAIAERSRLRLVYRSASRDIVPTRVGVNLR